MCFPGDPELSSGTLKRSQEMPIMLFWSTRNEFPDGVAAADLENSSKK